ncbi:MAG: sigma-54-dependent Fis family transcriptional regulator, partial [Acidobacteriaceae bacterium]|nr:sigma-54-dependent Fis family transcriptional regulator [Acidobacteriaceae bacterium]
RDLAKEVEAGRFRQDLYYRLNVMRLRLAPLRERKEDIPALVLHFLNRHGNGHQISTEVMDSLCAYDWPGNIRELEHAVQQMVAMNSGPWITPADLPSPVVNRSFERSLEAAHQATAASPFGGLFESQGIIPLAEVEKRAIVHAIDYTKGDRTVAAAMLGIGRTTLYRKLKEYGL